MPSNQRDFWVQEDILSIFKILVECSTRSIATSYSLYSGIMQALESLLYWTGKHNNYLVDRIDLVASNSWVSNWVRLTMGSLLANSYCIGLPGKRLYGGCDYIDSIEQQVVELATEIFGSRLAVVQFLSGMQANIAAYNAIIKPGDKVVTAPTRFGGHYSHNSTGPLRFFSASVLPVPFDERRYNIDLVGLEALLIRERPRLLVVGWSEFLFPHPLAAIRSLCDQYGCLLMYDMSHVAGLLAGGIFQPEASRLADIVTSSTGKSLHAPDHGICLYNNDEFTSGVLEAVMPLLTSNTHPHELAALGIALAEMKAFGEQYARQVVRNSKALGRALAERGVNVLYGDLDFSESHTLLVACDWSELAVTLLDKAGISANVTPLPWDRDDQPGGIRLGTQVVTRRGMKELEMATIADALAKVVLHKQNPEIVRRDLVLPLAQAYRGLEYSFDDSFPMARDWQQFHLRQLISI